METRIRMGFLLAMVAGVIELGAATIQALAMLASLGIADVFSPIYFEQSADKVNLTLYLTFPAISFILVILAGVLIIRGSTRRGGIVSAVGIIPSLIGLLLPQSLGYSLSFGGMVGTLLATVMIVAVATFGFITPSVEVEKKPIMTTIEISIVAVFSAFCAILTSYTGTLFPSPTGGYTHIGDTAIYVAALLFGAKVGGFVGIIGPVAADLFVGYPRWFVTVVAHGVQGFVSGLGKGKNIVLQVVVLAIGGIVMSVTYFYVNVFIKGYPVAIISLARDLFGQSLVSIILALLVTKALERTLPQLRR